MGVHRLLDSTHQGFLLLFPFLSSKYPLLWGNQILWLHNLQASRWPNTPVAQACIGALEGLALKGLLLGTRTKDGSTPEAKTNKRVGHEDAIPACSRLVFANGAIPKHGTVGIAENCFDDGSLVETNSSDSISRLGDLVFGGQIP